MMAELYKACQGMKKKIILDDDVDSDERLFFYFKTEIWFSGTKGLKLFLANQTLAS